MTINRSLKESFFIRLLENISLKFRRIILFLGASCADSHFLKYVIHLGKIINIGFKNSLVSGFFRSITAVKINPQIFSGSKAINWIIALIVAAGRRGKYYLDESVVLSKFRSLVDKFCLSNIKSIGAIFVIAVLTDTGLCFTLNKNVSIWGWLTRSIILLTGLGGMSCNASWYDIMNSSVLVKRIKKSCKA